MHPDNSPQILFFSGCGFVCLEVSLGQEEGWVLVLMVAICHHPGRCSAQVLSSLNTWEKAAVAGSHVLTLKSTIPGIGRCGGGGRSERWDERMNALWSLSSLYCFQQFRTPAGFLDSPSITSLGREDPLEKEMQPTPVLLLGKSHGQRSLAGYSARGHKELDWAAEHARTMTSRTGAPHLWLLR